MNILDKQQGALQLTLKSDMDYGDKVVFDICVNNGSFTQKYRFTKLFGVVEKLFEDDCETMDNWTSSSWNTTTSKYVSPTHSITDSPYGNYPDNANLTIYSISSYDLKDVVAAFVEFKTQWAIEPEYDYVQFVVSENNGAVWIPQHGKYTKLGSHYQDYGEPLYDGFQSSWVHETVDISASKGKKIKVGFRLISDEYMNEDGFYFDDFEINVIKAKPYNIQPYSVNDFTAYYSPATKKIIITNVESVVFLSLFNIEGKLLNSLNIDNANGEINASNLNPGIYFLKTNFGTAKKIVIY